MFIINGKRSTLKQQLDEPEFQSIQQVIVGELKAIDMVINEFSQLFDIQESEVMEFLSKKKEERQAYKRKTEGEGIKSHETNE
ncbi:hypothetical protein BkAM31D_08095 [Halalkalibacter krulwichiae]|uniref:Uncharacterized protein n=1 Tax=Halalkalibacter krulwichiae TaxID=199441 RepID=A0A1X9MCG0_9BACI|nr:hypothetical protein BkAM31D_08095 [Halalkalibacter krulwichiae]